MRKETYSIEVTLPTAKDVHDVSEIAHMMNVDKVELYDHLATDGYELWMEWKNNETGYALAKELILKHLKDNDIKFS